LKETRRPHLRGGRESQLNDDSVCLFPLMRKVRSWGSSWRSLASSAGHSPIMYSVIVRLRIENVGIVLRRRRWLINLIALGPRCRVTRSDWNSPEEIHLARMVLLQEDRL
jgi:hypothetical protein